MNSASDLLTRPDTLASPAAGLTLAEHANVERHLEGLVDGTTAPRGPLTYAAPSPDPVMVDALAERGIDDLLVLCALKRAAGRALRATRDHLGGGVIGYGAAMMLLLQLEADPAMDDTIDTLADALLAHAGSLVAAVPTTPSAESQTSSRIAAEIDALDLVPADLTLSPKAQHVAEVLELVPPRQPPTPPAVALAA